MDRPCGGGGLSARHGEPGTLAPEVRQTAIETLKTINAYAKTKKIFVTMENRGSRLLSHQSAGHGYSASASG